jgi:tryptophanyl-tRNA synthetase
VARKPVVEVNCSRCGGTEYVDESETSEDQVELLISFMGSTTQFDDLCSSCKKTVGNYVHQIVKDIHSRRSKAKEKAGPEEDLPNP